MILSLTQWLALQETSWDAHERFYGSGSARPLRPLLPLDSVIGEPHHIPQIIAHFAGFL